MPVNPTFGHQRGRARGWVASRRAMTAIALATALWAAGCAPAGDPALWERLPLSDVQDDVDDGLAALARGDYAEAEAKVTRALRVSPRHPYALLTAATIYQNTGRHARARQAYEEVLALPEPVPVSAALWGSAEATTAQELARQGLLSLNDASIAGVGPVGGSGPGRQTGVDRMVMPLGVVPAVRVDGPQLMDDASVSGLDGSVSPAAERFGILRSLRDAGLITQEEYQRRRAANLGALLPLTQRPPAAGLDRPVTNAAAIADRLRQLQQAYEGRYISAAQHAAERAIILDSLLPADSRQRAAQPLPPDSVIEVAAAVGRLERLRELGLITQAEMRAERARLEAALKPLVAGVSSSEARAPARVAEVPRPAPKPPSPAAPAATASGGMAEAPARPRLEPGSDAAALAAAAEGRSRLLLPDAGAAPAPAPGPAPATPAPAAYRASGETAGDVTPAGGQGAAGGPTPAVHLASFRSEDRAQAGWQELATRYPVLAGLQPRIVRVTLPGKGVFYRLHAAPLPTLDNARALCANLSGQYCEAVVIGP